MSVFATLRRSVGFGGGGNSVSDENKPILSAITTSSSSQNKSKDLIQSSSSSQKISQTNNALANLILENKNGKVRASYPIRKQITKIGRLASNDIRIYRETVSRVHCEIHLIKQSQISKASLHIFNPRGVKVNGEEVEKETKGKRIVQLTDGDLIEIYANYFRLKIEQEEILDDNENDENSPIVSVPVENQKSVRMSLVRSQVVSQQRSNHSRQSSTTTMPLSSSDRSPLKSLSNVENVSEIDHASQAQSSTTKSVNTSPEKASSTRKGRRSLVFATPKREIVKQTPYTAEPVKQAQRQASTYKSLESLKEFADSKTKAEDDSIIFMEEIEEVEVEKKEPEMLLNELDDLLKVAPIQGPDNMEEKEESNSIDKNIVERQSKSVSPKKMKRRSSFFGRAGIFANWNFGFYPEERKAAEEEGEKEEDDLPSSSLVLSPNGTSYLPEPRLDSQGRPRLPRSLSSPDGLTYSSPKRRIVSLRTATLLRQGQNAFEQQKLRSPPNSPPASPTKTFSTGSLMGQMQQILSIDTDKSSPSKEQELKISSDADDEDEINQSLSLADDEDDGEDDENEGPTRQTFKPRKSDSSTMNQNSQDRKQQKSRISMPAKLISVTSVEGFSNEDIEELKKQWLDEQGKEESDLVKANNLIQDVIEDHNDQARDTDTESEHDEESDHSDQEKKIDNKSGNEPIETAQTSTLPSALSSPDKKYGMLRYMVRENAELTALIDTVTQTKANETDKKEEEKSVSTTEVKGEVSLVVDIESKETQQQIDTTTNKKESEWQIVSPRRSKWKPSESKPVQGRRVSETPTMQKKNDSLKVSPKKKVTKRRITSAAAVRIPTEESEINKASNEVQNLSEVVEQKIEASQSPKKSSPRKKRSPVKKSAVAATPFLGVDDGKQVEKVEDDNKALEPVVTKSATPFPIQSSPVKTTTKVESNEVTTLQSSSPTKRRRTQSPKKINNAQEMQVDEDEEDKENVTPQTLLPSSSPTKQRKKSKAEVKIASDDKMIQSEQVEVLEKKPIVRRTGRGKKKIIDQSDDCPASEPVMPLELSDDKAPQVRTTRSGRSIRKPLDLLQPTTVISIHSDPIVEPESETKSGTNRRITRSRAKRGAAAAT